MANLNLIAEPGYLDALKNSRTSKLVELVNQKNAARQRLSDQMTHQAPPQPVPAISALGDYFNKVASGGYLKEHGQNFHDILSGNYEKALDYVGPAPMGGVPAMIGMTAFHGSPHKFNKFSLDNIGTGEGAQAYGHGLYFAENPKVAGSYANDLGNVAVHTADGEYIRLPQNSVGANAKEKAAGWARHAKPSPKDDGWDYAIKHAQEWNAGDDVINQLKEWKKTGAKVGAVDSNLYEVDIPDEHVANFLDWDAPVTEQKHVMDALKRASKNGDEFATDVLNYDLIDDPMINGDLLHDKLKYKFGEDQGQASEYLNSLGIKGIKYYDGMSRGAGEGTRNLVVFDDQIVKTLKRNSQPIE